MVLRAGFHGTVGQSSAQVIDGSLNFFQESNPYLEFTPGSDGNRSTWTISFWAKVDPNTTGTYNPFTLSTSDNYAWEYEGLHYAGNNLYYIDYISQGSGANILWRTNAKFRDTGWYHFMVVKVNNSTFKLYVNGEEQTSLSSSTNNGGQSSHWNKSGQKMFLGGSTHSTGYSSHSPGMSQFYFIDGLALGPGYFGFTDPLTNTWRPRKFRAEGTTVNDGTTWSNFINGTVLSGFAAVNAFDGVAGIAAADCVCPDDGTTLSFIPPTTIRGQKIEAFFRYNINDASGADASVFLNGADITSIVSAVVPNDNDGAYVTLPSDIINTTNGLTWSRSAAGAHDYRLSAIRVDGVVMLDSTTTNLAFGTNGFYLPMDGNSPIGEDKSGNGNDWRPVNFGGSVELDNPIVSGARSILNTTQGGTQAGVGVFGSKENKYYTTTSATNSGGKYVFENEGTQPTFSFIRGATYTFDYSASTGHPLRFATAADAAGSTEYTNGTSVSGNVISFTVPHNAPNTLYYYCTNHGNMGNSISVTTDETKADPYAWKCILAVPGVGGDYTDKSAQINCTSTTKASSAGGDPSSDGSCNFYNSSIDLDGNDKVTYTRTNAGDFSGQSDFTIEAWFNTDVTNATDAGLFSNWDSGNNRSILFGPNASGNGDFTFIFNTTGSGGWTTLANPDAIAGKWVHVAWVYDHSATRHYAYINGILQGSTTGTAYNNSTANFLLGVNKGDGSGYYNGKVQDLRYYHAVKYTASGTTAGEVVFTLPSTSPDILPDTPSGVSGSSKLTKITDGAVSFDGTGDYLSVTGPGTLAASSNWCMECFFYCTGDASGTYRIMSANESTDADAYTQFRVRLGQYQFYTDNWSPGVYGSVSFNKWTHIALTKSGTTVRAFVDGKIVQSSTDNNADVITNLITGWGYGSEYFPGFISNARFVNGSSVYTADFTPPTAPLTNITNTYLLYCQETKGGGGAAVSPTQSGYNTSASWTSTATQSNPDADRPIQHLFDGTTTNLIASPSGNNVTNRIELGRSITAGTSLRFYLNAGGYNNGKVTVFNGATEVGSVTAESSQASGFYSLDVGSFPLTFTAVQVSRSSNGYGSGMSQIEVDSSILKDPLARFGDAVATNFNPFNTDINTVRGQESGYATLNPLQQSLNSTPTISNGNLTLTKSAGSAEWTNTGCTMNIPKSGKWFWEITWTSVGGGSVARCGVADSDDYEFNRNTSGTGLPWMGSGTGTSWSCDVRGYVYNGGTETTGYLPAFAAGDVMGIILDRDNNTITYTRNGVSGGVAHSNVTPDFVTPGFGLHAGTTNSLDVNFGQNPFKFPPPAGFQPLNAANIRPETVIARPDQYVGIMTYSGTTANPRKITPNSSNVYGNINFTPDFVWVKCHDQTEGHALYDTVRGKSEAGDNYRLNTANANDQNSGDNELKSFIPNGFTCGNNGHINYNGFNYVAWCWKAGGAPTATNTQSSGAMTANSVSVDGVLQSAYTPSGSPTIYPKKMSVGTKQGFSIVQYEGNNTSGATLPHGLTQAPDVFITKATNYDNREWQMYHKSLGNQQPIRLNTADAAQAAHVSYFNNTSPTADVVTFGNGGDANQGGETTLTYIMYAWHNVPGLQKFGSYSGNGSATDGTFVELGFKPAVVIIKNSVGYTENWLIFDNQRNTHNPTDNYLYPNLTAVEADDYYPMDFLSNGFKLYNNAAAANTSGNSAEFIYMAWAEAPASNLYGGQSNAR